MEALQAELAKLRRQSSLSHAVSDVDAIIAQLENARNGIASEPGTTNVTLAKLQNPVKQGFDKVMDDLKKVYTEQNRYGKALDKNLTQKPLTSDALSNNLNTLTSHPTLLNRAIVMHLLREGQFGVASTFVNEMERRSDPTPEQEPPKHPLALINTKLRTQFEHMYYVLAELNMRRLTPAIAWARANEEELEKRGSNLEFELCKLQYLWLFQGGTMDGRIDPNSNGPLNAMLYGISNFAKFQGRFSHELQKLSGALAYQANLSDSPYWAMLASDDAWTNVSHSFTREFCSVLGLSADSPLYIAVTAGAIALPTLHKLANIMQTKKTEWTTQHELPVEIPLPKSMNYHAIFVCPVSKEQCTEKNPPMMMPCGHVLARESLEKVSKGQRFKCPYCPNESWPRDAREILL